MNDPISFFREVAARYRRCFWLDGGGAREWSAKRSMIGWLEEEDVSLTYDAAAREVRRHCGGRAEVVGSDIFEVLTTEMATGGPEDHWIGYFGYASRPDLLAQVAPPGHSRTPDAVWMRPAGLRYFDHLALDPAGVDPRAAAPHPTTAVSTNLDDPVPPAYAAAFAAVQEQLHAGNSYEVNLTYRQRLESSLDPVTAYLRLRDLNPAPYAGFLQHDVAGHRGWLLSSSPERYAVITEDRMLETKPIKGTTARGATAESDAGSRHRLASDPKYRAENLMIVDLLRNDLSMVCETGSVTVPELMAVESYPGVHQLVSSVRGRLRDDVGTVSALRALFPAGSMTGAPKRRTMEIIAALEESPRSAYAGAFGWICADGRADLGVVIRSLITDGAGNYDLGTGGGITVQSSAAEEYAESRWKAERLLRVFATN